MIKNKLNTIIFSICMVLFLGVEVRASVDVPKTIKRDNLLYSGATTTNNLSENAKTYIRSQLYNLSEELNLDQFKIPATSENANKILDTIVETTEIEYLYDTEIEYYSYGGYIGKVNLTRKYDKQTSLNVKSAFENKANEIVSKYIKADMSNLEKEVVIHNYLVNNVVYDEGDSTTCHNAYGALVVGRAVCDGYSKAFKYFMDRLGIESGLVLSDEMAHAWNYVKIDGVYYFVDTTWDDPVSSSNSLYKDSLQYFNVSKSKLMESHTWDTTKYPQVGDNRFAYLNNLNVYGRLNAKYFYYYDRGQNKIYSIDEVTGNKKAFDVQGKVSNFFVYENFIIYNKVNGGIRSINTLTGKDDQMVEGSISNNTFIKEISNDFLYYESPNGTQKLSLLSFKQDGTSVPNVTSNVDVIYQSHVQNIGWQDEISNGGLSGTTGNSLRIEALKIRLGSNVPSGLKIKYRTHVQNIGWQDWVYDGAMAGTQGQSLRAEALEIKLEGVDADKYTVKYQAHVENEGWKDWVADGQTAGSVGKSQRVEALKIVIEKKGDVLKTYNSTLNETANLSNNIDVKYKAHVQNIGWQEFVSNGVIAGTEGQALRLEAMNIALGQNAPQGLKIKYRAHVQNIGWQDWVYDGALAGTQGQSLRVEALEIKLEVTDADKYTVQYQAHVENEGWQNWVADGQTSGTVGKSQRIEAIRIKIVKK